MTGAEILFLVVWALVIGAVIGALARLIVPGTARFGILLTIFVGFVAALIGGFIGRAVGWSGWQVTLLQVAIAVVFVAITRRPSAR